MATETPQVTAEVAQVKPEDDSISVNIKVPKIPKLPEVNPTWMRLLRSFMYGTVAFFVTAMMLGPMRNYRHPLLQYKLILTLGICYVIFRTMFFLEAYLKMNNKPCEARLALYKMLAGLFGYLVFRLFAYLPHTKLTMKVFEINSPILYGMTAAYSIAIPVFFWSLLMEYFPVETC